LKQGHYRLVFGIHYLFHLFSLFLVGKITTMPESPLVKKSFSFDRFSWWEIKNMDSEKSIIPLSTSSLTLHPLSILTHQS